MNEKSYTEQEFRQAMREVGWEPQEPVMLPKIITQMDKNRAVKQGTGFSEEQVRKAVEIVMMEDGSSCNHADKTARAVLRILDESPQEPADGGVYRRPSGVLYKRSGGFWQLFGDSGRFTDEQLNFPVSELERVL